MSAATTAAEAAAEHNQLNLRQVCQVCEMSEGSLSFVTRLQVIYTAATGTPLLTIPFERRLQIGVHSLVAAHAAAVSCSGIFVGTSRPRIIIIILF